MVAPIQRPQDHPIDFLFSTKAQINLYFCGFEHIADRSTESFRSTEISHTTDVKLRRLLNFKNKRDALHLKSIIILLTNE